MNAWGFFTMRAWLRRAGIAYAFAHATGVSGAGVSAGGAAGPEGGAVAAAQALIRATPAPQHATLVGPFADEARNDWHYTPRRREGIAWRDLGAAQRDAALALLRTALDDAGVRKVHDVMALETALRELERFPFSRDPENYALRVFGRPGAPDAPWGWRIEGHHLSLHFTLVANRYVATLPQFFGAHPATVPRDIGTDGPRRGQRVLGEEDDRAWALLEALTPAQRGQAVFASRPFGDVVTRNLPWPSPGASVGLPADAMTPDQRALLVALVERFAAHLRPALRDARLERARAGGVEALRFGWAGATERGSGGYYFRIQGPRFLIEFDNSSGDHVHSVWRDFDGDWGRDALRAHHASRVHAHR